MLKYRNTVTTQYNKTRIPTETVFFTNHVYNETLIAYLTMHIMFNVCVWQVLQVSCTCITGGDILVQYSPTFYV